MKKRYLSVFITAILLINLFAGFCIASGKSTATELFNGSDIQSSLSGGTYRMYKIKADETQYYEFKIRNQSIEVNTGIGFADGFLNLFLGKMQVEIFDEYDEDVASLDVKCGYTGTLSVRLAENKTYYLKLSSTVAGNYHLNVKKLADLGGNTWRDATPAESTGVTASEIDAPGDKDFFKFTTDTIRSYYYFELENIQADTLRLYLYKYRPEVDMPENVAISGSNNYITISSNRTEKFNLQLEQNTEYYFCVAGSSDNNVGKYILNVKRSADAAGPTAEEAYQINTDVTYTTSFDGKSDSDYYVFTTASYDAYYHINYKYLSFDGYARSEIYDADSNQIASGTAFEKDFSYNVKLKPNTTYYVRFGGDGSGNYEFNVQTKKDTYPNTIEQASAVSFNTEYSTSFDGKEDADFVKITTLGQNAQYTVEYTKGGFGGYVRSEIYDSEFNQLATYNQYNGSFNYSAHLEPNSTYYVRIYADGVGNYKFKISANVDVDGDSKDEATELSTNQKYLSSLEAKSDIDWFTFTLDAPANMLVSLWNESGENAMRFYVYTSRDSQVMYDSFISKNDTGTDKKQLDAGTYYIKVYGDSAGYYTLTLSPCGGGHTEVIDKAVASSCTSTGLTEGKHCSVCNTVIKKQTVTNATGHKFKNGKCTVCSAKDPDYVPVFSDVKAKAWYKKYVDYSVKHGIFSGTSATTFSPNDNITRAQFVQVLANLEGVDTSNRKVSTKFSDVPQNKWFTAAVKWASENAVVNGVGGGRFDPNANVTREQMCVMLVNYAKFKSITFKTVEAKENFVDDSKISKWAKTAVYTCQQADIVNGKGAGAFDPKGTGTRAEASVIFTKFHTDYLS